MRLGQRSALGRWRTRIGTFSHTHPSISRKGGVGIDLYKSSRINSQDLEHGELNTVGTEAPAAGALPDGT